METFATTRRSGHAPHLVFDLFHGQVHASICMEPNPRPRPGSQELFCIPITLELAELGIHELKRYYVVTEAHVDGKMGYVVSRQGQPAGLPVSSAPPVQKPSTSATGLPGGSEADRRVPRFDQNEPKVATAMSPMLAREMITDQIMAAMAPISVRTAVTVLMSTPDGRSAESFDRLMGQSTGEDDLLGECWANRPHD